MPLVDLRIYARKRQLSRLAGRAAVPALTLRPAAERRSHSPAAEAARLTRLLSTADGTTTR
jgi:hypothetical protein